MSRDRTRASLVVAARASGRRAPAALLALAALVAAACASGGDAARESVRRVTIVAISDWHGQVEPVTVTAGGRPRPVGGAAALKAYFDRERARNPGRTLVVTAGDAFGATPPVSSFLDDVPAVEAMNLMGLDADTLGNHNFDHGLDRLLKLVGLARFPYVAANVVGPDGATLVPPTHVFDLRGVRVGVIGIANPETPDLVAAGRTGDLRFLPPAPVIHAHASRLRREGADVVVVLAHVGATGVGADGAPLGRLGVLARLVRGVDVLFGDHTDVTVNARVGDTLVVESRSRGLEYAVVEVEHDARLGRVVGARATHRVPYADEIAPDPALAAMVDGWRARVRPLFDRPIGATDAPLRRSRRGESALGNLVADALRAAYGVQIALVNSGGLRDDLPSAYQPAVTALRRPAPGYATGPPWDLVHGDLVTVFPFGNVAVTFTITGRTLWAALEHSVAAGALVGDDFVNASGRFLQVSGVTYRFDASRPPGRRIVEVRLEDGAPVAPDETEYSAATVDFVYGGGDGFTMLHNGTAATREPLSDVVARAVAAGAAGRARVEGRVKLAREGTP